VLDLCATPIIGIEINGIVKVEFSSSCSSIYGA
jgi:hypothetical protein